MASSSWTFLKALKREDTLTFVKKVKMMNREAPPLQPKKWRLYNQRLDAVVEDYDNYTDLLQICYTDLIDILYNNILSCF